jgi:hypothetical protein
MNGTDDTKQLAKAGSIDNATHHACVQRQKRRVVSGASRDRNNPGSRAERAHPADRIDPRHPAPAQVHQNDVGLMSNEATSRVARLTGFANHRDIWQSRDRSS